MSQSLSNLEIFCRQVLNRSHENATAFLLLHQYKLWGNALSIIGQEIDSMIRVVYLLSISNLSYRNELIDASVNGDRWTYQGTQKPITDRHMVEVTTKIEFWARAAYKVRNSFIHLSNLHDYRDRDPLALIPKQDKREIIKHLRKYHHGPKEISPTFKDIIPYLPSVILKMQQHLRDYVERLRKQVILRVP